MDWRKSVGGREELWRWPGGTPMVAERNSGKNSGGGGEEFRQWSMDWLKFDGVREDFGGCRCFQNHRRLFDGSRVRSTAGKRRYTAGKRRYTAGKRRYTAGKRRYTAGKRRYTAGKRRYTAGKRRYTAGKRRYTAGKRRYTAGKRRYTAGKRRYTAGSTPAVTRWLGRRSYRRSRPPVVHRMTAGCRR
ncbi:uncharacterized protein LOC110116257 [Dendrobium catenatum]|uniref:uncharacterized protein LOC110116257 n=1 Tax=Dendrobium catenatum TaxID=906689 RepID=UPI00109F8E6F|nr:uncharacterized protein LOC110116257 [Dendrobium catenatum]